MLYTGLTSITFRQLETEEIIDLVKRAGLDGIEWGGDVHVPPGHLEIAGKVRKDTESAGLQVLSYGSYYRCSGESGGYGEIVDTADALGAPVIRVWAGSKGSDEAEATYRAEVVKSLREAVDLANTIGITVALEYHGKTLTDTQESSHHLLEEVRRQELKLYWQPRTGGTLENDIPELKAALPHLSHVHIFHWIKKEDKGIDRRPLKEGVEDWNAYMDLIRTAPGDRAIIMEFVRDNNPEQFLKDAQTLLTLTKN